MLRRNLYSERWLWISEKLHTCPGHIETLLTWWWSFPKILSLFTFLWPLKVKFESVNKDVYCLFWNVKAQLQVWLTLLFSVTYWYNFFVINLTRKLTSLWLINFTAPTTAPQTQNIFMSKWDKRIKGVLGPALGKRLVIVLCYYLHSTTKVLFSIHLWSKQQQQQDKYSWAWVLCEQFLKSQTLI